MGIIWARDLTQPGCRIPPSDVVRQTGVHGSEINRLDQVRALEEAQEEVGVLFRQDEAAHQAYFRRYDATVSACLEISVEDSMLDDVVRHFDEGLIFYVFEDAVPSPQRLPRPMARHHL